MSSKSLKRAAVYGLIFYHVFDVNAVQGSKSAEGNCGSWQDAYKSTHVSALSAGRYAIASGHNGLAGRLKRMHHSVASATLHWPCSVAHADHLTGAVSVFLLALLSGRAFMMRYAYQPWCPECQPHLEWAYDKVTAAGSQAGLKQAPPHSRTAMWWSMT
jgi:hypothetical protein